MFEIVLDIFQPFLREILDAMRINEFFSRKLVTFQNKLRTAPPVAESQTEYVSTYILRTLRTLRKTETE